ncbi:MAG: hypothetical protein ACOYOJ_22825, partial [Alsobacter sp.]
MDVGEAGPCRERFAAGADGGEFDGVVGVVGAEEGDGRVVGEHRADGAIAGAGEGEAVGDSALLPLDEEVEFRLGDGDAGGFAEERVEEVGVEVDAGAEVEGFFAELGGLGVGEGDLAVEFGFDPLEGVLEIDVYLPGDQPWYDLLTYEALQPSSSRRTTIVSAPLEKI